MKYLNAAAIVITVLVVWGVVSALVSAGAGAPEFILLFVFFLVAGVGLFWAYKFISAAVATGIKRSRR